MRNNLLKCSTLAMLAVAMIVGAVGAGEAWADTPPDPVFPFFGAGAGQIFRFQVAAGDTTCHATLSFADTKGDPLRFPPDPTLRFPPSPNKPVYLERNQSDFFDLDVRALGVMRGQRLNFRPVLMYSRLVASGPCFASFEVFEPFTARTLAMAHPPDPGSPVGQDPPEPGFPVGLAFGQTLLLGVSANDPPEPNIPPPCKGELHLHAADGKMVGMLSFDLMPGHAAFLSLNSSRLGLGFGQRAGIAPCIMPAELGSTNGCKVSVQVLDNFTMWTTGMAAIN